MSEDKQALKGGLDASEQSDKRSVEKELSGIERYDDMIDLPRPKMKHARMSAEARTAQFAPFAALVGFYDKVAETGKQVIEAVEHETEIEMEECEAEVEMGEVGMGEVEFTTDIEYEGEAGYDDVDNGTDFLDGVDEIYPD